MTAGAHPSLAGKTLLMPDMSPTGSRLLVAALRAFGVDAVILSLIHISEPTRRS
jgi:hypothetical protein